jgi:hypothetical protein
MKEPAETAGRNSSSISVAISRSEGVDAGLAKQCCLGTLEHRRALVRRRELMSTSDRDRMPEYSVAPKVRAA